VASLDQDNNPAEQNSHFKLPKIVSNRGSLQSERYVADKGWGVEVANPLSRVRLNAKNN